MRAAFCVPAGSWPLPAPCRRTTDLVRSCRLSAACPPTVCHVAADCLPCGCRLSAMWLLSGKNAKLRSDAMCLLSALRGPPAPACSRSSNPWCMGMPRLLPCRPSSSILGRLRGQSIFSSVGLLGFPQTQPPAICVSFPHPLARAGGTRIPETSMWFCLSIPRACGRHIEGDRRKIAPMLHPSRVRAARLPSFLCTNTFVAVLVLVPIIDAYRT